MSNSFWGSSAPRLGQSAYMSPYIPLTGYDSSPIARAETFGAAPAASGGNWLRNSGFLNSTGADGVVTQGWGMPALGAAKGLFDSWMAMKSYGLAKQQLSEGKRQFGLNFDAQMKTTNSALEDRQRARVASNPGAYQSVGEYMNKNAIKGG